MLGVFSGFSGPPESDADAARFLKEANAVADEEPPVRSMLGSLADEAGPSAFPLEDEGPSKKMLALDPSKPPDPGEVDAFGHLTQHSTIAELAGLEEHVGNEWPIERGVLISLLFHISVMLMLLLFPARIPKGRDLFAMLEPEPRDDTPIPVILDAPGPKRANPKPAPLSDADRLAGGGDRSKPKADTPFVPKTNGVEGLAPGPRAPRIAGRPGQPQPPAPAQAPPAGAQAPEQSRIAEQSPDAKPSEFPTEKRAGGPTGPREIGKLANLGQAIQEAARGAVASSGGEGGAPPANPDGGFVDSGPLSFDTKWYDWGAYAAEMIRRIKLHWDIPELARLGWKGSLTVRFYIMADGTVGDAKIIRYSGIPPFDNAALQAILKSSPFRPLPDVLHEEREGVSVTFFYNMRPESEEARSQP
jgi:TonB family protein